MNKSCHIIRWPICFVHKLGNSQDIYIINTHHGLLPSVSNQLAHVTTDNPVPAAFTKWYQITPASSILPITHEPCDFLALHLGRQNSWESIYHHHHCSQPMHSNSIKSPNVYLYPSSHQILSSQNYSMLIHSNSLPPHPYHSIPSISPLRHSFNLQSNSYSHQPPAPINMILTIQHPHGISPTKLKITKIILFYPTPSVITPECDCISYCTCSAISPV